MLIQVRNEGQKITGTDYYGSEAAKRGMIYCSINASCFRLLLPPVAPNIGTDAEMLKEMRTGKNVEITRKIDSVSGQEALEFVFDDGTDSPFFLLLGLNQLDRNPAVEPGQKIPVSVVAYTGDKTLHAVERQTWNGVYQRQ